MIEEVTSINGYTFTSTDFPMPVTIVDAVGSTEDMSYLAFGVWLTEWCNGHGNEHYTTPSVLSRTEERQS